MARQFNVNIGSCVPYMPGYLTGVILNTREIAFFYVYGIFSDNLTRYKVFLSFVTVNSNIIFKYSQYEGVQT